MDLPRRGEEDLFLRLGDLDFSLLGDLDLSLLGDFDLSFLGDFDLSLLNDRELFLLGDLECLFSGDLLSEDLLLEGLCGDLDRDRWGFLGEGDASLCLRLPLLSGLLDSERRLFLSLSLDRDLLLLCSCLSFFLSSCG